MTRNGLSKQEKADLAAALAERNNALENDNLAWAAKQMPDASSPLVVEAAFHKARYECLAITDAKRLASQKWLADRGFGRMFGGAVKIGDPLPSNESI